MSPNSTSHDTNESENSPESPHLERMRKQCVPGTSRFSSAPVPQCFPCLATLVSCPDPTQVTRREGVWCHIDSCPAGYNLRKIRLVKYGGILGLLHTSAGLYYIGASSEEETITCIHTNMWNSVSNYHHITLVYLLKRKQPRAYIYTHMWRSVIIICIHTWLLPYSGKFSRGPRDFRDPRPNRENKNREIRNREHVNFWKFLLRCLTLCASLARSDVLHYICKLVWKWCRDEEFVNLPSLLYHSYLVCILFGMSSLHLLYLFMRVL